MTPLEILLLILLLLLNAGFTAFIILSFQEGHQHASWVSLMLASTITLIFLAILLSSPQVQRFFAISLALLLISSVVLYLLPIGEEAPPSPMPSQQVDERTILFARANLKPGTQNFNAYYAEHPEHLQPDNAFRQNPGLLNEGAVFYEQFFGADPKGSFFLTEALRNAVDGPIATDRVVNSPEKMTAFIKNIASYHGAVDVGVCELQPYHIYSHIGRGTGEYGAPITLNHTFAIAFTVEMAHDMLNAAPKLPTVAESAKQYVEAAKIAVTLAAAIREMGYPARAHIDGNYRVIAPLVAKDAGLGEIGRMGLLMTPRPGPRVRLGVVTTDLPLIADPPTQDASVIDFCSICEKCADVCPAGAIPHGDRQKYEDGTSRWKINPERCYTYWTKIGTDCGRCMAVCPYAHEDNFLHNLIRWGVSRSGVFRRAAYAMDNVFYGKKPQPKPAPTWIKKLQDQ
ncbi:MAG: reductive dehalogenase domain-containing protein [Chloroflexota bacterium]|jgi:reductive dehalogenase|nr:reductive dehalogenase domain-containing protein [Chloroflexota bacterium]